MFPKTSLAFVTLLAVSSAAQADNDPEYQKCAVYGADVHNFIDCLVMARDTWDRSKIRVIEKLDEKLNDAQRKPFNALLEKQRNDRNAKCGRPNPNTVEGAECQRAMAKEQAAAFENAAKPVFK